MGLTRLPTWTFYWVSQLGMLPATVVYVNAGAQLGRIESVSGVLSPTLLGSFALLAIFPFVTRRIVAWFQTRRLYARFTRPQHFDANLVVIGAGSAGLVTAYVAAAARAKVVLIEADRMGGDCLNTGCVPSKALIRSGRVAALARRAGEFGLALDAPATDFPRVMERVRRVIESIEPHDSVQRYTALGVECISGRARLTSPWTVAVTTPGGERTITARSIVLATGGTPALPAIPGLRDVPHVTSDSVWELAELPARLLVLGGGPIGCELAQAFRNLGSAVTIVEMLPGLLAREDDSVGTLLAGVFETSGIHVLLGCRTEAFERRPGGGRLRCVQGEATHDIDFDMALIAVGRTARTAGLGLEALGIALNANGTVSVNEYLQTRLPDVYACGDVAGPWQLTHVAAHQAWYCAMNALWGRLWRFRADYSVLPATVYTDPEVARVGLTEAEARATGQAIETVTYDLSDLDRAIAEGEARGFVKVVTPRDSDRILGVTVVGAHAGETISEFVLAMRHGLGLRKILGTVHSYPTFAEANKFAAGTWQRRHLPGRLLDLAGWFNRRQL
jgi:pyruvate/2-oxoglutarate dehydrogenase complex dihydrolipoamide dehydrogenase (E3) component